LATATHDTKRGEDLRARLNVLSEIPDEWGSTLSRWGELNRAKKTVVDGQPAPHPNDEYFFYQTLLGAWPSDDSSSQQLQSLRERIVACVLKSIKEAKTHTSWLAPNSRYEEATKTFVEKVLADSSSEPFLNDFKPFQRRIAFFGRLNSLAQILLKMTSPGVPDFYQGTELWDLNLVDPDNRRPVDYEIRRQVLAQLKMQLVQAARSYAQFHSDLLNDDHIGRSKLYLIWRVLEFRNRHRALFDRGNCVPLAVEGAKREHVCAFARVLENEMVVVVVPRLVFGLLNTQRLPLGSEVWEDTRLELPGAGRFSNVLTGQILHGSQKELPISQILSEFPVALLDRTGPAQETR
jgi:(1->4)-alpha-D-glucan 1-alpha-D-glucosylmutase